MMYCQVALTVQESSQVGEVRRQAQELACDAGLDATDCGRACIVATELATNLVRYAVGGEILLRTLSPDQRPGIELIAIDRGPGMSDVARCLEDGYSSGGSPGNGLGAVQRLSTEFDIFSGQPQGTVVLSRIVCAPPPGVYACEWGAINRPAPNQTACGDTWRLAVTAQGFSCMVADGLGHGEHAAEAAAAVAQVFEENQSASLSDVLSLAHDRSRSTRGSSVAVARLDGASGTLRYAGVGNISGTLRSRDSAIAHGLVSHNGTVGAEMRKVQEFDYVCPPDPLLVLHSDGLLGRWSFEPYPALVYRHPAVIAAVLYRDFNRGRDDVTVCVLRFPLGSNPLHA